MCVVKARSKHTRTHAYRLCSSEGTQQLKKSAAQRSYEGHSDHHERQGLV